MLLFHAINAHRPSWLDDAMALSTRVGDYRSLPAYLVWVLGGVWQWRCVAATERVSRVVVQAKRFVAGTLLALLLTSAFKLGFDFPRPVAVLGPEVARVLGDPEGH